MADFRRSLGWVGPGSARIRPRALSSVGRAPARQAGGHWFEPSSAHSVLRTASLSCAGAAMSVTRMVAASAMSGAAPTSGSCRGSGSGVRSSLELRKEGLVVRRTLGGCVLGVVLLALAGNSAASRPHRVADRGRSTDPQLQVRPRVARRGHGAAITVTELDVPSLEVLVAGGTSVLGNPLPWKPLRLRSGAWRGVLPRPARRGVYELELRVRAGERVLRSDAWLLRVFARGTEARPSFAGPAGVAAWWVRTVPTRGRLVATRRWPLSIDDRRDPRRHQKLVVAYTVAGHRKAKDRLGVFVTAFREGRSGRWRLLEASVAP